MAFQIPRPLHVEHEELHAEIGQSNPDGGQNRRSGSHCRGASPSAFCERGSVCPATAELIILISRGEVTPEMRDILPMTDRLQTELPQMLAEHKAIVAALHHLVDAAKRENQMAYARFAEKLMLHAEMEEEVLYPTAILIGEYLKLKLNI